MRLTRLPLVCAALLLMTATASGHYHWVFFAVPGGPYQAIPGRFDLNALAANTVNYFISDQGPSALMPADSPAGLNRQIQEAAKTWNNVATSSLRLQYGGIANVTTAQSAPGIDVIFDDDMPPGVLAQTRPTFPGDLSFLPNEGTTFVPLLRSRIQIRRDLTLSGIGQASYTDAFYLTLVHEFGHALGLQHSMTSGAMSTAVTRGTVRGAPLAADDVAAISSLYPTAKHAAATGAITGRVMLGDTGANLASVVALSANGTAVSGMTNPDGSYRIAGIPPGQYLVYVHPLPPAIQGQPNPADIVPPVDINSQSYPAQTGIDTHFYPNTRDWTQATVFDVVEGATLEQVDFAMEARPGAAIHSMRTYGYQGDIAVSAPPFTAESRRWLVFHAYGTTIDDGTAMAPGLGLSAIGGAAQTEPENLGYHAQGFLRVVIASGKVEKRTPVALAVTLGNELYVLPAAFSVSPSEPPSITSVVPVQAEDGRWHATITGSNLGTATKILFDGAPGTLVSIADDGLLTVAPPFAPSGHAAVVEAVNPDGQSSLQALDTAHLQVFTYPVRDEASIAIDSYSLSTGTDGMLAISGIHTHFAPGHTTVGFGSSDITVRQLWVLDPTHLLLNVTVNSSAPPQPASVTVSTGLETAVLSAGVSVTGTVGSPVTLRVPVRNAATGLPGVPAGGRIRIVTVGLPAIRDGWTLSIGGHPAPYSVDDDGVITADVPADLPLGPHVVQLNTPDAPAAPPVLVQIDPPPPTILTVFDHSLADGAGGEVTFFTHARAGDIITITVDGLTDVTEIWLDINGVISQPDAVTRGEGSIISVRFTLPSMIPYNAEVSTRVLPIRVGSGTRLSGVLPLPVFVEIPAAPPAL